MTNVRTCGKEQPTARHRRNDWWKRWSLARFLFPATKAAASTDALLTEHVQ